MARELDATSADLGAPFIATRGPVALGLALLAGIAAFVLSDAPLYLLALIGFPTQLKVPGLGQGIFVADLMIVAAVAGAVLRHRVRPALRRDPVLRGGLAFLFTAAVVTMIDLALHGVDLYVAGLSLVILALCLGVYVATVALLRTRRQIIAFAVTITVAAAFNACAALVAWWTETGGVIARYNFDVPFSPGFGAQFGLSRMGFLFALSLLMSRAGTHRPGIRASLWAAVLCCGTTFCIVLTRTELILTPLMVLALAWLVLVRGRGVRPGQLVAFVGFVVVIGALGYTFSHNTSWLGDVASDAGESHTVLGRLLVWNFTWDLIRTRPLLGFGFGQSLVTVGAHEFSELLVSTRFATPHNGVLGLLLETGVVGTLVAAVFFGIVIRTVLQTIRVAGDPVLRALACAAGVQLAWMVVSHVSSDTLLLISVAHRGSFSYVIYAWMLLGLVGAVRRHALAAVTPPSVA